MKYVLLIFLALTTAWAHDTTKVDSVQKDTTHVFDISHHLNTRSNEGTPFDWFLNIDGKYKYTKGIHPSVRLYVSRERDDDTLFTHHIFRVESDYFFVEDHVDEEHRVNAFSSGIHYKWQWLKAGYAMTIDQDFYHGVYLELDHKWVKAHVLFRDKTYRYRIAPTIEFKQGIYYFSLSMHYTKEINSEPYWEAGYKGAVIGVRF